MILIIDVSLACARTCMLREDLKCIDSLYTLFCKNLVYIRILRLRLAKFEEYAKNIPKAEIDRK